MRPLGYQQLSGISVATALTIPAGAAKALISVETNNVRWRDDGTAPTATVGQLLKTTDPELLYLDGGLGAMQFIPVTSTATVNVTYYG